MARMVRLHLLTGMRPGEVCSMRLCDIDRSGDVWKYSPEGHKTEHHGRSRVILLGRKAQRILQPLLNTQSRLASSFLVYVKVRGVKLIILLWILVITDVDRGK